tara:strand:- start:1256 stop:1702 length:447 start_codon:yes stop_codon:yes gene_type:complete
MEEKLIKRNPCVGVCSTTYGDDICKGCKRFRHEVSSWTKYSDVEKNIVNRRLEKFKALILNDKFSIVDQQKFELSLKEKGIRYNKELDPICWIIDLLRTKTLTEIILSEFGLELKSAYQNYSITQISDLVHKEFLDFSEAHYDRYIEL